MTEMNGHKFSLPRLQSMFAAAEQFGLSEEELRQAADQTLDAISDDATVPEYFDELAGALARRILAKQLQASSEPF
jgi:hypothetical protein